MDNISNNLLERLSSEDKIKLFFLLQGHIIIDHHSRNINYIANKIRNSRDITIVPLAIDLLFKNLCDDSLASSITLSKHLESLVPCWLHAALLCSLQKEHLFSNDLFITTIINKPLIDKIKIIILHSPPEYQELIIKVLESKLIGLKPDNQSLTYGITKYLPPII
jgi:hypothetical protein